MEFRGVCLLLCMMILFEIPDKVAMCCEKQSPGGAVT